jgi:hypothetical protein
MNKKILLLLLTSTIASAGIDYNKGFPVVDLTLHDDLLILEACCEKEATCCIDFSSSASIDEFRNNVRAVDSYRDSEVRSRMRTMKIKQRLNQTVRRYNNRFNEIGKYYSR